MNASEIGQFVNDQYDRRETAVRTYFSTYAPALARACHAMAERFARGGRILAFGLGPAATDAQHISVEFVHPVIVGKRALPAVALPNDGPTLLGRSASDPDSVFARQIDLLGRPDDIAVGLMVSASDSGNTAVEKGIERAAGAGMLTVAFSAHEFGPAAFTFGTPATDPFIVQEVQETAYHILWELVHVFFEHKGLLHGRDREPAHEVGAPGFLYPFLAGKETNLDSVLAELEKSILAKAEEVITLRGADRARDPGAFEVAARILADGFAGGGQVLAFGNGGSATDAQDFVTDLLSPPGELTPRAATSLTNDSAVVTAVGNDVGYDNVFSRQIIAYGRAGDVAVGISTSGGSRNVIAAFEEARRRGMASIGFVGYGGGDTVARELCDATFVIDYEYIPRIQEAQASQYHILRRLIDAVA